MTEARNKEVYPVAIKMSVVDGWLVAYFHCEQWEEKDKEFARVTPTVEDNEETREKWYALVESIAKQVAHAYGIPFEAMTLYRVPRGDFN